MPNLTDEQKDKANAEMKSFEAVVNSMTPYERRHPETLKYSREEPDRQRQPARPTPT
jgi:signal recognition particle GTPase